MKQALYKSLAGIAMLLVAMMLPAVQAQAAEAARTVTGTVVDEIDEPLIGVSVTLPGFNIGVTTDIDGHYTINVPAGADKISFTYVGYNNVVRDITANVIDVQMQPSSEALQEMV